MLFLIIFAFVVCIIASLILYARWNYGKLDNLGFPVIPPSFILGSVPDLHEKVQHYEDIRRFKKYGKVWGLYQGRTPLIFIADPELIKKVFVQDVSHFFDREAFSFGDKILDEILDFLPGDKWKTMRVSQTKLFSSGKIKQYSNEIFKQSMENFLNKMDDDLKSANGRICIDARERFCHFTVDCIGRSMFSMKVEPTDNDFYVACKRLIGEGRNVSAFYIWTLAFPFLSSLEPTLNLDPAMPNTFLNLIKSRKANGQKFDDFGDIMSDLFEKLGTTEFSRLGIKETTILAQGVNLFLAGFDRISTMMTFLAYHLAENTQAQESLVEEIDSVVDEKFGGEINYQTFAEMPYLTACINETLRLYPTFIRPERVCNKDWVSPEFGIKIPAGINVMIASWAANRDPEIYEFPDRFMPERFLPENKAKLNPYAFSSFGFGHRSCIGQRFTYEALKVAVCHLFHRYQFELREDTKINFKRGIIHILQYDPVYLDVVERKR